MGGEIASTAILLSALVLLGLGVGFVMLRLQGGEELGFRNPGCDQWDTWGSSAVGIRT